MNRATSDTSRPIKYKWNSNELKRWLALSNLLYLVRKMHQGVHLLILHPPENLPHLPPKSHLLKLHGQTRYRTRYFDCLCARTR